MIRYINCKIDEGIKTIHVFNLKEYKNKTELFRDLLETLKYCKLFGHNAWMSKRATKEHYKNTTS